MPPVVLMRLHDRIEHCLQLLDLPTVALDMSVFELLVDAFLELDREPESSAAERLHVMQESGLT